MGFHPTTGDHFRGHEGLCWIRSPVTPKTEKPCPHRTGTGSPAVPPCLALSAPLHWLRFYLP